MTCEDIITNEEPLDTTSTSTSQSISKEWSQTTTEVSSTSQTTPTTTKQQSSTNEADLVQNILERVKRNIPSTYTSNGYNRKTAPFKCFRLQHAGDNNRRATRRGCVKFEENVATTCDNAIGKRNGFHQCVLCAKDRCNFGNTIKVSLITLTTSIFIFLLTL